jgi:hypothetical protein
VASGKATAGGWVAGSFAGASWASTLAGTDTKNSASAAWEMALIMIFSFHDFD